MKVTVAYIFPLHISEGYGAQIAEFIKTYQEFPGGYPHELIALTSPEIITTNSTYLQLSKIVTRFEVYSGTGQDIGAFLEFGKNTTSDLLVCLGVKIHFWKSGWLKRLVEAYEQVGEGLYGPMGSYEVGAYGSLPLPNYHLRTTCFACTPRLLNDYPYEVHNREDCFRFEFGDRCFTRWVETQGYPVRMVTWSGIWTKDTWRTPPNVFRKGDQSDLLVRDAHTDLYACVDEIEKIRLAVMTG